jgi:hypothetical protein
VAFFFFLGVFAEDAALFRFFGILKIGNGTMEPVTKIPDFVQSTAVIVLPLPLNTHVPAARAGSASPPITPPPDGIHEREVDKHDANEDEDSQGHARLQFCSLRFAFCNS